MRLLIFLLLQLSFVFGDITDKIEELSKEIRGQRWECVGNISDENHANFKALVKTALEKPKKYEPNHNPQISKENREYFKFWAYKSISNFVIYEKFWQEYEILINNLNEYYKNNFNLNKKTSEILAKNLSDEFLHYAVGSFLKFYKMGKFEKIVSDKNLDKSTLISAFYRLKPNKSEITNALNIALLNGASTEIINQILEYGANLNVGDENSIFFSLKNLENLEILVKNGAEINHKNSFGKTPLFYAVEFNDYKIAKFLIKNGSKINEKYINQNEKQAYTSNSGLLPFYQNLCSLEHTSRTIFMHASYHANTEILELLVENGADIYALDDLGYNALDYAILGKNVKNQEYLSKFLKAKE